MCQGWCARSRQSESWSRIVPVDFLVVQAYGPYVVERDACREAGNSDFVLVNLFRLPLGVPMPPGALNDLFDRLSRRVGLADGVHPHALRGRACRC